MAAGEFIGRNIKLDPTRNHCARNVVRREKARSLSGLEPTRQLSLQPVAIGAVVEETKRPKPSV